MRALGTVMLLSLLITISVTTDLAYGYARITVVDLHVPVKVKVNEQIPLEADIYTGNNLVEYVHNVSVALLLPSEINVTSGLNPLFVGEMGPGPAITRCQWTIESEEPGRYTLTVNATCIDTQYIARWMNASATIAVYGPPHAEFEYAPASVYVHNEITFNATKSFGQGPNSQISTYSWYFGDGTDATTFIPIIRHAFRMIGNYTVSLNVTDDSPFELSATNATVIRVSLFGDLNSDGQVDILDIATVARAFGSRPEMLHWDPEADLNNDGTIDILDVALVATQYGKTE